MYARWTTFGIGLWLMLAPLVLGYGAPAAILHEVAVGLLVCVATIAALDRPAFRFVATLPGAWLLFAGRGAGQVAVAIAEISSGAALLLLAAVPSARRLPRAAAGGARA